MSSPPKTIVALLLLCLLAACSTPGRSSEETFKDSFTFSDSEKNLWINAFVDRDQKFYLSCSLEGPATSQRRFTRSYRLVYGVESPQHLSLSAAEDDAGAALETTVYLMGPGTGSLAAISVALPPDYLEDHRDTGFAVLLTGDRGDEVKVTVSAPVIDGFLLRCDYEEERSEPRARRRRRR